MNEFMRITDVHGWGATCVKYEKEDVEEIYLFLKANKWNVSKVFTCVWEGRFKDSPREFAPLIVDLIQRIAAYRSDDLKDVWDSMAKECAGQHVQTSAIVNN